MQGSRLPFSSRSGPAQDSCANTVRDDGTKPRSSVSSRTSTVLMKADTPVTGSNDKWIPSNVEGIELICPGPVMEKGAVKIVSVGGGGVIPRITFGSCTADETVIVIG